MKTINLLLIVLCVIIGMNNAFSQNGQSFPQFHKNQVSEKSITDQLQAASQFRKKPTNEPTIQAVDYEFHSKNMHAIGGKTSVWMPDTVLINHTVYLFARHTYSYNENLEKLEAKFEICYDNYDVWETEVVETFDYDDSGNLLTILYQDLRNDISYRYSFTYDLNGNKLTSTSEEFENNVWVYLYRNLFVYNDDNQITEEVVTTFDSGNWANLERTTYTYDENTYLVMTVFEFWHNNNWEVNSRRLYTNDSSGKMLVELGENNDNGNWVALYRNTCSYNDNGNLETWLYENCVNNVWENDFINTYSYDEYNRLTCTLTEFSEQNPPFEMTERYICTYDTDGNMTTYLHEYLTSDIFWENDYRITCTYDNNGNSISATRESWVNDEWQVNDNFLPLFYNQQQCIDAEYYGYHYEASFISTTTGVAGVQNDNSIEIYPNPSNDYIEVNLPEKMTFSTLSVYNVLGNCLLKTQASGTSARIDIQSLAAGSYLLVVQSGGEKRVSRFVVQ